MNWKHFLRGLGAGIIFSTLIVLVAYMTSGSYKISDEEVIARAEKLGMVMRDGSIISDSNASATDANAEKTEEVTTEKASEKETAEKAAAEEPATEITTTENVTTEKTTTEKATTEKATTEKPATEKATTEKPTTEQEVNSKYITADITVTSGMGSEDIAKLVQDAGIIDDYLDFDNYLNQNGYSQKLSVNTFSLNSNMTYEEIAKELTKGDKSE